MELLHIPLLEELARYTDMEHSILIYLHDRAAAEPGIEICRRYRELDLREDVFPELAWIPFIHSISGVYAESESCAH